MSQAYFNMDKIGTAQRPYKNFTTQDEMFDVIVAQARKVLDQTDVEQIIPTGTVLQNLRTSPLNNEMDLTRDGYHMDYGLSRYAAACAVFEFDHLAFVRRQETRWQQLPLQRVEYGGRHLYDARDRRQSAGCAAGGALRPCHALCRDRHVARHPDARQRDRGHRF